MINLSETYIHYSAVSTGHGLMESVMGARLRPSGDETSRDISQLDRSVRLPWMQLID
jgi:hypothetical protein